MTININKAVLPYTALQGWNIIENLVDKLSYADYQFETTDRVRTIINVNSDDVTVLEMALMFFRSHYLNDHVAEIMDTLRQNTKEAQT